MRFHFHHLAWSLLAYNVAVVLGGAFVRATLSGDGCGHHWPDCHGQWLPPEGRASALIEFSHRLSSGLLLPLTLWLLAWAFRRFPPGHPVRKGAAWVLGLTLVEAGIGAALVLFRLVGLNASVYRALVMPAHLITTFLLLAALALTAWWASGGGLPRPGEHPRLRRRLGLAALLVLGVGITGAISALGDTLFPARSLAEGLRQDFSPAAHFLVSLRVYHPLLAVLTGLYVAFLAAGCLREFPAPRVQRLARSCMLLYAAQLAIGTLNLALLAPVWMQLLHLLTADLFWVSLVLLGAAALAEAPAPAGAEGEQEREPLPSRPALTAVGQYLALTKPRVCSLLLFTTLAAMWIAAGGGTGPAPGPGLCLAVALGFYMAAGAANAINMVLERDLDLRMGRTALRPTVTREISGAAALRFAAALSLGSFLLLWSAANLLSALLAFGGLVFYVVVYTLLLKRRTWLNIVIGGAAGAFPPLVGWAAVTGELSPLAWCLFGIIFLWTPVHFWALAIVLKQDYARAGVPMLPVVRGERATVVQIAQYAVLTAILSVLPMALPTPDGRAAVGWFYLGSALLLNAGLILRSFQLYRRPDHPRARSLFKYSMVYLALLFLAMAVDRARWL